MTLLFKLLARVPLVWMQALGVLLGWVTWATSSSYRRQFRQQVDRAGVDPSRARAAIAAAGRMLAELPWVWARPMDQKVSDRIDWVGEEHLLAGFRAGRGVIIMSPHLGSWEIGAQALAERHGGQNGDWVVLYRPARKAWLRELVELSRQRGHVRAVPTNLTGVRSLVRALRAGAGTAILPDQVPPLGQGVWAPFWGQPAYTMTLLPRLVQQTGASVLLTWCERCPGGRFRMHLRPWNPPELGDPEATSEQLASAMNQAIESLVRAHPDQYLWGYERHKQPREGD
ncbi:MAG: lysophospholipid acyltransferase family protein [Alphaproteobacteria bacterium]|nr:lysophospholipid acyltransferase family protein [Alphaproteobacteria bacterium]MDI9329865.1 lysophospholipid acyltransferase family protein [Alphaproteobacteria bacterium]